MSASPSRNRRRVFVASGVALAVLAGSALYYFSRSDPRSAEREAALALAERGPPEQALAALKACLERDPDDPGLLRAIVRVLPQTGTKPPDVEPFTERWCRAAPDDPEAFRARLKVLQQLKRQTDAIAAGERVLALAPDDHNTRAEMAALYLGVGRYDDAARECRRLLDSPLPRAETLAVLGRVEAARGNNAEAATALDQALAAEPHHVGALLTRGIVHQQLGEDARAVEVLRRVSPRSPTERVVLLHHLGLSLSRAGREDEARRTFDELVATQNAIVHEADAKQEPGDVPRQVRAGRALLAAGMAGQGAEHLEAAIDRLGPDRGMLEALADCYDRLGAPERAKVARDRAADLPR